MHESVNMKREFDNSPLTLNYEPVVIVNPLPTMTDVREHSCPPHTTTTTTINNPAPGRQMGNNDEAAGRNTVNSRRAAGKEREKTSELLGGRFSKSNELSAL